MAYVAVAYLAVAALLAAYVLSLVARQRIIADLADAVHHSTPPHPTRFATRRAPAGRPLAGGWGAPRPPTR